VHCTRCGHCSEVNAAVADLAVKTLRCAASGHRQSFAPETIRAVVTPRQWTARSCSTACVTPADGTNARSADDRLDDLWAGA
jgi:hypothetical protein